MEAGAGTVFLVDDDASIRQSLGRLIGSYGWQVRPCASAKEFLGLELPDGPACVLLDVLMPEMSGPDVQQQMVSRGLQLPIVFLTGQGDVPTCAEAMKRGAVDFLQKPVEPDTLVGAIRSAIARHEATRGQDAETRGIREHHDSLTSREREVLQEMLRGRLNKQIAADLGISIKTVKVHRGRVMEKMQVRSVAELVHLCEQARLVPERA